MSLIYLGWGFICDSVVCITLLRVQPIPILSAFFLCHPYIPLSNFSFTCTTALYNIIAAMLLYYSYRGVYRSRRAQGQVYPPLFVSIVKCGISICLPPHSFRTPLYKYGNWQVYTCRSNINKHVCMQAQLSKEQLWLAIEELCR